MSEIKTDITFAVDKDTGGVVWFYPSDKPDLTEQQALVIGVTKLSGAMQGVADGLYAIAAAIEGRD